MTSTLIATVADTHDYTVATMATRSVELQEIGTRLTEARDRRGLSQAALGRLVGVERATISRYESGEREMSVSTILRICRVLDVQPGWLLGDESPASRDANETQVPEPAAFFGRFLFDEYKVGFADVWQRLTPFERSISAPVLNLWAERARSAQ